MTDYNKLKLNVLMTFDNYKLKQVNFKSKTVNNLNIWLKQTYLLCTQKLYLWYKIKAKSKFQCENGILKILTKNMNTKEEKYQFYIKIPRF